MELRKDKMAVAAAGPAPHVPPGEAGSRTGIAGRLAALAAGPLAAGAAFVLLQAEVQPGALSTEARWVAALAVLMAVWWVTEAINLAATALLPIVVLPAVGVCDVKSAAEPYADPVIFLFMGGLMLGKAMETSGLHRRIALHVTSRFGRSPGALIAGVMLATALISMWVSNTATAVMMLPIGAGIVALVGAPGGAGSRVAPVERSRFATAMMLGIAYSASIGGMGTKIGTPPNAILAAWSAKPPLSQEISFFRWMMLGVPMVAILLPVCWVLLTRILFPIRIEQLAEVREDLARQRAGLGPAGRAERSVLVVFALAATAWIFRGPLDAWLSGLVGVDRGSGAVTDASIAIVAVVTLMLIPSGPSRGPVLPWERAEQIPWGVLILFGGGLSLADAMTTTGLDAYIGSHLHVFADLPLPLLMLCVCLLVTALSELASNTAVVTALLPMVGGVAAALDLHPFAIGVPLTLAASLGFMLPMATPPNAIAFSTGHVGMRQMLKAGFWLDLVGAGIIVLVLWLLGEALVGVRLDQPAAG